MVEFKTLINDDYVFIAEKKEKTNEIEKISYLINFKERLSLEKYKEIIVKCIGKTYRSHINIKGYDDLYKKTKGLKGTFLISENKELINNIIKEAENKSVFKNQLEISYYNKNKEEIEAIVVNEENPFDLYIKYNSELNKFIMRSLALNKMNSNEAYRVSPYHRPQHTYNAMEYIVIGDILSLNNEDINSDIDKFERVVNYSIDANKKSMFNLNLKELENPENYGVPVSSGNKRMKCYLVDLEKYEILQKIQKNYQLINPIYKREVKKIKIPNSYGYKEINASMSHNSAYNSVFLKDNKCYLVLNIYAPQKSLSLEAVEISWKEVEDFLKEGMVKENSKRLLIYDIYKNIDEIKDWNNNSQEAVNQLNKLWDYHINKFKMSLVFEQRPENEKISTTKRLRKI